MVRGCAGCVPLLLLLCLAAGLLGVNREAKRPSACAAATIPQFDACGCRSYLLNLSISFCRGNENNRDGLGRGERRGPILASPEPPAVRGRLRTCCGMLAHGTAQQRRVGFASYNLFHLEWCRVIQGESPVPVCWSEVEPHAQRLRRSFE